MDGVINVYKEQGYTSFDVVAKLRGILKTKKIGHTGTLDPMAEGVLPVCVGRATKLCGILTESDKYYEAEFKLGLETDTEDITGQVVNTADEKVLRSIDERDVREAVMHFVGEYDQIPPMYSAIKVDGKKLYDYARKGIEIERKPRHVCIFEISGFAYHGDSVSMTVHCSKGTYIRSLVRDIGRRLGCYATLTALKRTLVYGFEAGKSLKLDEIAERVAGGRLSEILLPIDSMLKDYEAFSVPETAFKPLKNGNKLKSEILLPIYGGPEFETIKKDKAIYRIYDDEGFKALYEYEEASGELTPYRMFL